jgi:SAM-dependent methyltransferase
MSQNQTNAYDADVHIAEVYDQVETELDDVHFIQQLAQNPGPLKILEPFFGTGRIGIELALAGHTVTGIDQSAGMRARAAAKIERLPSEVRKRITLHQADVLAGKWRGDFDFVILGCNCFYELATPAEQEKCIALAHQALQPDGYLFIDNDHMEGELELAWQDIGVVRPSLNRRCADGTKVESTRETIWFDVSKRLARFRRRIKITLLDGKIIEQEYIQQKHPVSQVEVKTWLEKYAFITKGIFGNYSGTPYTEKSPRAIFWAEHS